MHVLKPGALPEQVEADPIIVRVNFTRFAESPDLYLQSKRISWDKLDDALRGLLKLRREWVVYVDSGSDSQWADVIKAVDIIKRTPATVILLTPQMKARLSPKKGP